jgi:outer membrane protein TolC
LISLHKFFLRLLFIAVLFTVTDVSLAQMRKDTMVWNGYEMVPLSSIPVDSILFDLNDDIGRQIEPLDSILAYAVKYSPELMFEDASIEKAKYNTKYTRYLWLNGVTGFANYTYGNQTNLNTQNADGSILNNSLGVGYRLGANITIPMTEVFGRPNRMKQLKAEEKMAKYKRADAELELKRKVISDYFNLIAAQKVMKVRQQDVESARLSVEIASVEMRRGKIHPSELSRLKNILTIAESNLEITRRDFMVYYYQLEVVVGVKLSTLRRKNLRTF